MISLINHDSSEVAVRSQWGRYNLPSYINIIISQFWLNHNVFIRVLYMKTSHCSQVRTAHLSVLTWHSCRAEPAWASKAMHQRFLPQSGYSSVIHAGYKSSIIQREKMQYMFKWCFFGHCQILVPRIISKMILLVHGSRQTAWVFGCL